MNGNFEEIIEQFCFEGNQNGYEFLLKADVSGWLFHHLVNNQMFKFYQIHLDTRVGLENLKIDLTIGNINYNNGRLPFISAQLLAEVKLFPRIGYTDTQHKRLYLDIIEKDLPKLSTYSDGKRALYQIIVDSAGYLNGKYKKENRLRFLIQERNRIVPSAILIIIKLVNGIWKHEPFYGMSKGRIEMLRVVKSQ